MKIILIASSLLLLSLNLQAKVSSTPQIKTSRSISVPQRGSTMKKVLRQYGKAKRISYSKGKTSKKWPNIIRWEYARFSVYFEKNTVLHTVIH